MRTGLHAILCFVAACASAGCGAAAQPQLRARGPLTAEQAALFSDGVDMLEDPALLQDSWRMQWSEEAERLAAQSQLVVRGTVTTVQRDQDPDQRSAIHLVVAVERVMVGEHAGGELVLRSREDAAGFGSVQEHADTLLRMHVVAFVRFALEDGREVAHFRVARPSTPLQNAIDARIAKDHPSQVKIVEHTQE